MKLLRSSSADRRRGWQSLWEERATLRLPFRAFLELDDLAEMEPDAEIMSLASNVIERLRKGQSPCLQDMLWSPFSPPMGQRAGAHRESAVIAVCDEHYIRDAHPIIDLALRLSGNHDVRFHPVSFDRPDWSAIRISGLHAVCFVGRLGLFRGCSLRDSMPRDLRFGFPEGDKAWRAQPVTPQSQKKYHRLEQRWQGRVVAVCEVSEFDDDAVGIRTRVDYAVVQKFPMSFGGRTITAVVLAGATSLGTAAAVQWAIRQQPEGMMCDEYQQRAGAITEKTRIEVLLEVTAGLHLPRRPWKPQFKEIKLFLDGSPNLISRSPEVIRLDGGQGGADRVRGVFFDDDGIDLDEPLYSALVALCIKAAACQQATGRRAVLEIEDLISDTAVWPGGGRMHRWADWNQARQFYLDKFQRPSRLLHGCLHTLGKSLLRLDAWVELTS